MHLQLSFKNKGFGFGGVREYDAILIGAGHDSLACAAYLAPKGWKTAILERNPTIGGAVRTGEFTLPGFRRDFGAVNLSLFAGSAFYRKYANELKAAGLEFAAVTDKFRAGSSFLLAQQLGGR